MFNKIMLAAIAAGWANVVTTLVVRPAHADNQSDLDISDIARNVHDIWNYMSDIHDDLNKIAQGKCGNNKLC
jgi:hypothetical protein